MKITIEVINPKPDSIYSQLEKTLGRKPTNEEIKTEITRILKSCKP